MSNTQAAEGLRNALSELGHASYGVVLAVRGLNTHAKIGGALPDYTPQQWAEHLGTRELQYDKHDRPIVTDWIDQFVLHGQKMKRWAASLSEVETLIDVAATFMDSSDEPMAKRWTTALRALVYRFVAIYPEWFAAPPASPRDIYIDESELLRPGFTETMQAIGVKENELYVVLDAPEQSQLKGKRTGKHRKDAGNKLKAAAKREIVFAYLQKHDWDGTLKDLREALLKKGLDVSEPTISRYLRGTRYQPRMGKPKRAVQVPGRVPGKLNSETEAVADQRDDLSEIDAYTMLDDVS